MSLNNKSQSFICFLHEGNSIYIIDNSYNPLEINSLTKEYVLSLTKRKPNLFIFTEYHNVKDEYQIVEISESADLSKEIEEIIALKEII